MRLGNALHTLLVRSRGRSIERRNYSLGLEFEQGLSAVGAHIPGAFNYVAYLQLGRIMLLFSASAYTLGS